MAPDARLCQAFPAFLGAAFPAEDGACELMVTVFRVQLMWEIHVGRAVGAATLLQ